MLLLVPVISLLRFQQLNFFNLMQKKLAFIRDKCCHQMFCLQMIEPHWSIFHRRVKFNQNVFIGLAPCLSPFPRKEFPHLFRHIFPDREISRRWIWEKNRTSFVRWNWMLAQESMFYTPHLCCWHNLFFLSHILIKTVEARMRKVEFFLVRGAPT